MCYLERKRRGNPHEKSIAIHFACAFVGSLQFWHTDCHSNISSGQPLELWEWGGSGRIAFNCQIPSNSMITICLSKLDGAVLQQFAHLPAGACCPRWSPDGRRIAFSAPHGSPPLLSDIWVMNADGSGLVNLTRAPQQDNQEPSWSPDGKQIVFSALLGNTLTLSLMHADSSQKRLLLRGMEGDSPAWSPDGKHIAFISQLGDTLSAIYVMNTDGSYITRLTRVQGFYSSPVWSPDGKHLLYAYTSDSLHPSDVYVMNANGSQPVRLVGNPSDIASYFPTSWSPDGTKILLQSVYITDGHSGEITVRLWVMNADGSGQTPLSLQTQFVGGAVWQP